MVDCGAPVRLTSRIFCARRPRRRRGERLDALGRGGRGPVAEALVELGLHLAQRKARNDEDLDVVGPDPALLEGGEVGALEATDRLVVAARRAAVGMRGAVHHGRQQARADPRRVALELRDPGQRLGADAVDLGGLERRVADDVGEDVERRREVRRQRRQHRERPVGRVAGADVGAQPLLRLGELLRASSRRCLRPSRSWQRRTGRANPPRRTPRPR